MMSENPERERLEAEIAAFLARGGKITKIESGTAGEPRLRARVSHGRATWADDEEEDGQE